jgi:hypothetical protein
MMRVLDLLDMLNPPNIFATMFIMPEEGMTVPDVGPVAIQKLPEMEKVMLDATNNAGVTTLQFELVIQDKCDPATVDVQLGPDWLGQTLEVQTIGNTVKVKVFVLSPTGEDVIGTVEVLTMTCTTKQFGEGKRTSTLSISDSGLEAFNEDGQPVNITTVPLVITILKKGDTNGDGFVNTQDTIKALRFLSGVEDPTPAQEILADVHDAKAPPGKPTCGNGVLNLNDLFVYVEFALGTISPDEVC